MRETGTGQQVAQLLECYMMMMMMTMMTMMTMVIKRTEKKRNGEYKLK
jgi:hypothetical protein